MTPHSRVGRGLRAVACFLVACATSAVASGCSEDSPREPTSSAPSGYSGGTEFPGRDWARATPADADLAEEAVTDLTEAAAAAGSSCLAIVRDGRVVVDENWPGSGSRPQEVYSVTKSVTSVLIGVAEARGELSVEEPVSMYVPEWRDTEASEVTIEDILTGLSGRHWDAATDYGQMALRARDKTAFAIGLDQVAPPGTVWTYNNSAVQVLSAVLEEATGVALVDYAQEHVFEPLGMSDSALTMDRSGGTMTFMGMQSTCLDVARLGHLMLNQGRWAGDAVLDPDYVAAATRPGSDLNDGYGRLWWLNRPGTVMSPLLATTGRGGQELLDAGQLLVGAPQDIFWALGFKDQVMAVIPELEVVAVKLGPERAEVPFGYRELTTGVLDAVQPQ